MPEERTNLRSAHLKLNTYTNTNICETIESRQDMLLRATFKRFRKALPPHNQQKCHKSTLQTVLADQLEDMRDAGTYKVERVITSPQASVISVENMEEDVINFCANNYLGCLMILN